MTVSLNRRDLERAWNIFPSLQDNCLCHYSENKRDLFLSSMHLRPLLWPSSLEGRGFPRLSNKRAKKRIQDGWDSWADVTGERRLLGVYLYQSGSLLWASAWIQDPHITYQPVPLPALPSPHLHCLKTPVNHISSIAISCLDLSSSFTFAYRYPLMYGIVA